MREENENEEENLSDDLERILEQMPKELRVMELGVDAPTMMEFSEMRQEMGDAEQLELAELPEQSALVACAADLEAFRPLVVRIAEQGSVEAFRLLEQTQPELEGAAQTWLRMAMLHCRMRLENELMDEPVGFIATGLGGKGDKIRYYFAVRPKNKHFEEGQGRWVEQEYIHAAKEMEAEIESCAIHDQYVAFVVLLAWRVPVLDLIARGIDACDFLDSLFWVTNVAEPTAAELQQWIDHAPTDDNDE